MDFFSLAIAIFNCAGLLLPTIQVNPCLRPLPSPTLHRYSTQELRNLQPPASTRLQTHVLNCLREHNICISKKTKRGKRGGQHKIKTIVSKRSNHLPVYIPLIDHGKKQKKEKVLSTNSNNITINTTRGPSSLYRFLEESSKFLKICLLNIQSVGKKMNSIYDFISDSGADIIFFTETWLSENGDEVRIKSMTPPEYKSASHPRTTGIGGGICTFFKNIFLSCINLKQIHSFKTFECSQIDIKCNNNTISIFCIYRPPPSEKNKFTPLAFVIDFENFLDQYVTSDNEIFILGDFNLHFDCPNETYVKKIINVCEVRNFKQMVSSPTQEKGHILDWVLVRNQNIFSNFTVQDPCLSDHFAISFVVNFNKPTHIKKNVKSRNLRVIDHS